MARFPILLALCAAAAAAVSVSGSPVVVRRSPVTVPFARRFNYTGTSTILEQDRARAQVLKNVAHATGAGSKRADILATNDKTHYTVQVGIGSPPTYYNLLVDTGSSNTFIGADKAYVPTSTSHDTGNSVSVSYGSGKFAGEEWTDTVTLGTLVIENQGISVASDAHGFSGVDGIIGIGPVDLTKGTVANTETVPTVVNNAYSQGLIESDEIGIAFSPASESEPDGVLTFGGVDSTRFVGEINYVPITSTNPASLYVGIDQSVTYGSDTAILSSTAGITDTGTTLVLLATDAFNAYKSATGAVADSATGLLKITSDQFANLQSLFFHIGGETYEFTANAQIWPRALNTAIGGDASGIYLVVADVGSPSGQGLDFINGYSWLERFYHVYDIANSRVGIANTPFTTSSTN